MTQVEDFWNIKKTHQSNHYKQVKYQVIEGKCFTRENIVFYYNNNRYTAEFYLYFTFKKTGNDKFSIDGDIKLNDIEFECIYIYDLETKQQSVLHKNTITSADLADMNNPISKAVRASKYAIEHLFKL